MIRYRAIAFAAALALTPLASAIAQVASPGPGPSGQQSFDMRDDASAWINDPHVHAFYQLCVEAFAGGPDQLDRAAYDKRFREIFTDFAVQHHIPPDRLLDHVKAIPGEMVLIVRRDPKTLDSYDNFVVALFGPQPKGSGPGAEPG